MEGILSRIMSKYEKIEIASQFLIDQYMDIADDFIIKICEKKGALLTDESSLYDFDFEIGDDDKIIHKDMKKVLKKIEEVYGVDVSDIEDGNLVEIFKRIRILGNFNG